ncbi:MAG: restriction endonuclease subunit S [bacterium]|nr:restriction endonuclease subunit S [bacterium]
MSQNSKKIASWQKVKLSDFAEINPQVNLVRGEKYPFLDMADVQPLSRITNLAKNKIFTGSGARFEVGDTLFARITPCLENGKITQVLNINQPGFGSTEFIVLRGKKGISENNFIHYLARTYRIRKLAEQSMIGASGRQRVEREAFEKIELEVPQDINEQSSIASVLSAFDDKIELNNKINATLEKMAQAIFKEWFVKFRFPGHEKAEFVDSELGKIPKGWEVKTLGVVAKISYGKDLPTKNLLIDGYPVYGGNGIIGYADKYLFEKPQVIVGCRGAYSGNIFKTELNSFVTHNSLIVKSEILSVDYLYYSLLRSNVKSTVTGSAQPQITINELSVLPLAIPSSEVLNKFEPLINSIEGKKIELKKENVTLVKLRDLLLPKLMKGEVRV